jgi:hypothetical protein
MVFALLAIVSATPTVPLALAFAVSESETTALKVAMEAMIVVEAVGSPQMLKAWVMEVTSVVHWRASIGKSCRDRRIADLRKGSAWCDEQTSQSGHQRKQRE